MIKRSHLSWVAFAAMLVAVAGFAFFARHSRPPFGPSSASPQDERSSVRLLREPCKLCDGLYLLGHLSPAAVYIVETSDGLLMIDSGLEAEYDKIVSAMGTWRLDFKRLKMILLTHVHGDHSMGAARLRSETGAEVLIGRDDAGPLRQGAPWDAIFSRFDIPPDVKAHPTDLDGELVDGQVLTLGDARITVISTPGHTLGSVCYLVEQHGKRLLFTGDTVMSLADGLGTYSAYLAPRFRGETAGYLASLKKLRALPVPDFVLPGHPESDPEPQDPHLSQERWQELLNRGIREMEELAGRYARDGADFLDGTPKQLTTGLFYLGDMRGNAAYALVSDEETLLFDAAGESDVPAFLTAAWRKLDVEPPPATAVLLTSCRPDNIAGLESLVTTAGCRVVASPAGVSNLARSMPGASILAADDIAILGRPGLQAIATPGADPTAVSYHFSIGDDEVLVTGELPIERSLADLRKLSSEGVLQSWDIAAIRSSLAAVEFFQPKLWLSAHPLHGRNANLYGSDWLDAIARNRKLLRRLQKTGGLLPADSADAMR